jgi:hypothetical protein
MPRRQEKYSRYFSRLDIEMMELDVGRERGRGNIERTSNINGLAIICNGVARGL